MRPALRRPAAAPDVRRHGASSVSLRIASRRRDRVCSTAHSPDVTEEPTKPTAPGESLLSRISTEIVRSMKQEFGKGPESAKSYMLDDFLLVVLRGGVTTAEQTMLDFGEADLVREFRQTFENRMTEKLVDKVELLTGRKVITYQSQILFDPHIVVELFFFDRPAEDEERRETAEGQLRDPSIGEARDAPGG